MTAVSALQRRTAPPPAMGIAALAGLAYQGADLEALRRRLADRLARDPQDAAALLDLSILTQLAGRRAEGLALQAEALRLARVYRQREAEPPAPRLLVLAMPGDFMANAPIDFLLAGSPIGLDLLFVDAASPLPEPLPEHDLALLAIGESAESRPVLARLEPALRTWPRPVLNAAPGRIAALARDAACRLLDGLPGLHVPPTVRVGREALVALVAGRGSPAALLAGAGFPVIVRPTASHAGQGLARLADAPALAAYLAIHGDPAFFMAPFVDYRGADGFFRKYRIAVIAGRPFACHMAIADDWMVHYLSAGMEDDAARREEEARFMADFDGDFAVRHGAAFAGLAARIGLDYFAVDCGEMPDGRLLLFEADVAMIVHAMESAAIFPYKHVQMRKVFGAFQAMLRNAAAAPDCNRRSAGAGRRGGRL